MMDNGKGFYYNYKKCTSKYVVMTNCKTITDEYLFSDTKMMVKLKLMGFKAKVIR